VLIIVLFVLGRGRDARDVARFIPDCIVLFKRLLGDPRVPRSAKLAIGLLVPYLAMPFDLVPDFIPVAGQLDDALVVWAALRSVLRSAGPDLLAEHWPGTAAGLELVERLVRSRP
jgi:uncharacterized membrane protein YkvA (DUF1232 family)